MIALILATGFHVVNDLPAIQGNAGQTAAAMLQGDDGADPIKTVADSCHICSVVSFLEASPALGTAIDAPVIPKGRVVRLSMVTIPLTAPPPRA